MAKQRKRRGGMRGKQKDGGMKKILRFGAIPLLVLLLIIIIMVFDHGEEDSSGAGAVSGQQAAGSGTETGAESMTDHGGDGIDREDAADDTATDGTDGWETGSMANGDDGAQTSGDNGAQMGGGDAQSDGQNDAFVQADPSQYPFQQDAVLELTGLVQSYCEAKKECDPELLAWVFGIKDWSEEEKEEERSRMELVKASIKSYENISCYSVQGPEENSYVIFPYYEIRYRETETLMPSFSWGYAVTDESGRYYMVSEIPEAVNDYIRKTGEKAEVKAVMAQLQARQQEAIASDEVLQKIYGTAGESEVVIGGVME